MNPRRRTRISILIAVAVFLTLLGIALSRRSPSPASPHFILTNGAQVTLVSAEFPNPLNRGGWTTLNRYDGGWRDRLYPKLPRALLAKFGVRPLSFISVGSNLAVWLKFNHVPAPPPGGPSQQYFRLRPLDPAGFATPANWPSVTSGNLALYIISNYPQRSSEVSLQLEFSDWKKGGVETVGPIFTLHNPYVREP